MTLVQADLGAALPGRVVVHRGKSVIVPDLSTRESAA
jgi:hypothetical protein